ncbi:MAG: hypothetical protein IJ728_04920 [Selenomonadaceae bacterium]|nr:hypothetical protein [Selenomonadaceae bacterium]
MAQAGMGKPIRVNVNGNATSTLDKIKHGRDLTTILLIYRSNYKYLTQKI